MKINPIFSSFFGKPENYSKIDNYVSRSAQPVKEDFAWLKEQGVTDVINFRYMTEPGIDFDEKTVVEELGMKYHRIPSRTSKPTEENIRKFVSTVDEIIQNGGKPHIHCKAGADRTGMYSFIYKTIRGIGTEAENEAEWLKMGHHKDFFPDLIQWTKDFMKKFRRQG